MNTKLLAGIVIIIIAVVAVVAYVATDDNDDNDDAKDETSTHQVTDVLGREVAVPDDLSDGVYVFGWSILKVASYFDDRQYIEEVDKSEAGEALGNSQSHYYCYDMSKMKTHEDTINMVLNSSTVERVVSEKPSLVLIRSDIYEHSKDAADTLAKEIPLVVVDMSAIDSQYYQKNGDGTYTLDDSVAKSIAVIGDAFGEKDRATAVTQTLNDTISDLATKYAKKVDTKCSLQGSQMVMASGKLNVLYPIWNPLDLAQVPNAAASYGDGEKYVVERTAEEFMKDYDFDVMFYDPSVPNNLLSEVDNQSILKYLYGLQGTENEKPIYVVMISALTGYDMVNLMADTYFVEATVCHTLSVDEVKEKLNKLYCDLYGDDVGNGLYDKLAKAVSDRSSDVALPLFEQVKVGLNDDGKYTLVAA